MRLRLALFTIVWQKREYRAFLLIMVFLSLSVSSTLPLVTLYLVDQLHVALSQAGLFFGGEALFGLILGLLVGRRSDRWNSRLPAMRLAAIWEAVGWLIFALSPYPWLTVSVGAVFLSAGAVTMGQAFAALHDVMVRDGETRPGLINTTVRTAFSFGFVLGPLLGSELAALVSFRVAFLVAGCLILLCLVPLRGLDVRVSSATQHEPKEQEPAQSNLLLYVFVVLCTLVLTGSALRITYLPIDVTRHLGGSLSLYGTVMAVSPIAELVTMPAAGLLALRFGIGRLFSLGLAVATVEYLILSFNSALWQVYLTQVMDALVVAAVFGLGLTYAQQLSPGRAGLVSSAFGSAFGIATLVGNLVGSVSVPFLGVPHIFFIPLVTSGIALATFIGLDRTAARHVELVSRASTA
jgi:SET family sugar efflux transporter-like MFS transporter